jgi:hypothetical protein
MGIRITMIAKSPNCDLCANSKSTLLKRKKRVRLRGLISGPAVCVYALLREVHDGNCLAQKGIIQRGAPPTLNGVTRSHH